MEDEVLSGIQQKGLAIIRHVPVVAGQTEMEDEVLSGIQQKGLAIIRHVPVVPSLFMFMQHIFL